MIQPTGVEGGRAMQDDNSNKFRIDVHPFSILWLQLMVYPPGSDDSYGFPGTYISSVKTQRANTLFNSNMRIVIGYKTKYWVQTGSNKVEKELGEIFPLGSIVDVYVYKEAPKEQDKKKITMRDSYIIMTGYVHKTGMSVNSSGEAELELGFKPLDCVLEEHNIFLSDRNLNDIISAMQSSTDTTPIPQHEKLDKDRIRNSIKHGNGDNIAKHIRNIKRVAFTLKEGDSAKTMRYGGKITLTQTQASLREYLVPVIFDANKTKIGSKPLSNLSYLEKILGLKSIPKDTFRDFNLKDYLKFLELPYITNLYYEPLRRLVPDGTPPSESHPFNMFLKGDTTSGFLEENSLIHSVIPYYAWFVEDEKKNIRWRTTEEFDKGSIPYYYIDEPMQYSIDFESKDLITYMASAVTTASEATSYKFQQNETAILFGTKTVIHNLPVDKADELSDIYKTIYSMLYGNLSNFSFTKIGKATVVIPYCPVRVNYPLVFTSLNGDVTGRVTHVVDSIDAEGVSTTTIDMDMISFGDAGFAFNYNSGNTEVQQLPPDPPPAPSSPLNKKKKPKKPNYRILKVSAANNQDPNIKKDYLPSVIKVMPEIDPNFFNPGPPEEKIIKTNGTSAGQGGQVPVSNGLNLYNDNLDRYI